MAALARSARHAATVISLACGNAPTDQSVRIGAYVDAASIQTHSQILQAPENELNKNRSPAGKVFIGVQVEGRGCRSLHQGRGRAGTTTQPAQVAAGPGLVAEPGRRHAQAAHSSPHLSCEDAQEAMKHPGAVFETLLQPWSCPGPCAMLRDHKISAGALCAENQGSSLERAAVSFGFCLYSLQGRRAQPCNVNPSQARTLFTPQTSSPGHHRKTVHCTMSAPQSLSRQGLAVDVYTAESASNMIFICWPAPGVANGHIDTYALQTLPQASQLLLIISQLRGQSSTSFP